MKPNACISLFLSVQLVYCSGPSLTQGNDRSVAGNANQASLTTKADDGTFALFAQSANLHNNIYQADVYFGDGVSYVQTQVCSSNGSCSTRIVGNSRIILPLYTKGTYKVVFQACDDSGNCTDVMGSQETVTSDMPDSVKSLFNQRDTLEQQNSQIVASARQTLGQLKAQLNSSTDGATIKGIDWILGHNDPNFQDLLSEPDRVSGVLTQASSAPPGLALLDTSKTQDAGAALIALGVAIMAGGGLWKYRKWRQGQGLIAEIQALSAEGIAGRSAKMNALQGQLNQAVAEEQGAGDAKAKLQQRISDLTAQQTKLQSEMEQAGQSAQSIQKQIDSLTQEKNQLLSKADSTLMTAVSKVSELQTQMDRETLKYNEAVGELYCNFRTVVSVGPDLRSPGTDGKLIGPVPAVRFVDIPGAWSVYDDIYDNTAFGGGYSKYASPLYKAESGREKDFRTTIENYHETLPVKQSELAAAESVRVDAIRSAAVAQSEVADFEAKIKAQQAAQSASDAHMVSAEKQLAETSDQLKTAEELKASQDAKAAREEKSAELAKTKESGNRGLIGGIVGGAVISGVGGMLASSATSLVDASSAGAQSTVAAGASSSGFTTTLANDSDAIVQNLNSISTIEDQIMAAMLHSP